MRKTFALFLALGLIAAGCGDDGLSIDGAWARTSPRMADAGAVYMQITSPDGDTLVDASVDSSVAGTVEIHETVMAEMGGDDMGGEDGMEGEEGMGAMMMQEVGRIDLPAGEQISLEPGGLHIMMLDLPEPLATGETFDVTLTFAEAGEIVVEVEVREDAP